MSLSNDVADAGTVGAGLPTADGVGEPDEVPGERGMIGTAVVTDPNTVVVVVPSTRMAAGGPSFEQADAANDKPTTATQHRTA